MLEYSMYYVVGVMCYCYALKLITKLLFFI